MVASREDLPAPMVDVVNIGLSDHRLLRWSTSLVRQPPVYTSVYLAVPGGGLTVRRFGLACGRDRCAPPTPGLDSISTVWFGSTTPRSPLSLTAWCRSRLSHADGGRLIRGSTTNVPRRNGKSAGWSVPSGLTIRLSTGQAARRGYGLPVSTASKARGVLADQDRCREFDATPAVEVYRRTEGPWVSFCTFDHRSNGLSQILRRQDSWGACIHRRCLVTDVHSGRPRMQFYSF